MNNEQFSTVKFFGKTHVIRACDRSGSIHKSPNFNGTGKALCAIIDDNETFEDWVNLKAGKYLRLKK
jgi:hypothetical protein